MKKKKKQSGRAVKPAVEAFAKIKVVGVGGSGGNALARMIANQIRGVEFIAVNTDAQALAMLDAHERIHIGQGITRGLGAGMDPVVGKQAAVESEEAIRAALQNADMVFITCGMGGGTGTGASSVIADIARDLGALTVAVVTKPFTFEGAQRRRIAEEGLAELAERVDTILTIPNDKILQLVDRNTSLVDSFKIVDEVLRQGVAGISEIITVPGLINVDFADVKTIMRDTGPSLMGIGRAGGDNRARAAAEQAIASPLLELSIDGARGILFIVAGGPDLTMMEVTEAAETITRHADPNAKIIFGTVIDRQLEDEVKVTVIATGFGNQPSPARSRKIESEVKKPLTPETPREVTPPPPPPKPKETSSPFVKRQEAEITPPPDDGGEFDIPAFIRRKLGR